MDSNYTESLWSGPATAATRGRLHGGCHRGRVGSLLTGRLKDTLHEGRGRRANATGVSFAW